MITYEVIAKEVHEMRIFKQEGPWSSYTSKSLERFQRQVRK